METLFRIVNLTMETPAGYGWFHLMFCAIVAVCAFLLCFFLRDCSYKTYRRIMLIGFILVFVCELYKEFQFTFTYSEGAVHAHYQWYIFPFQFCSTVFYVLPFLAFMKRSRFTEALAAFTGLFVLLGGMLVFAYPDDCYIDIIGINIQTMVHHGTQIVLGLFTLFYFRRSLNFRFYLGSVATFAVFVLTAVVLDETVYPLIPSSETFNMFYISRHYMTTLPVANLVYGKVPYAVFVLLYFLAFSVMALAVFGIAKGIERLVCGRGKAAVKLRD